MKALNTSEEIIQVQPLHSRLRCPDCAAPVVIHNSEDLTYVCSGCMRDFECRHGIVDCLPLKVSAREVKESEKAGWQEVYPAALEDVRQFYMEFPYVKEDNGSEFYKYAAQQMEIVMSMTAPVAGKRGLDLGGGFGWAAYRFTKLGAHMTLADYNDSTPSGMGGAQVYADNGITFDRVRVDAEALPFADDQFDFVFCSSFLHHLTDPAQAIAHISRVLRPGGQFFAIMEAFCPFWSSRESALNNAHNIDHFTGNGINEQVFFQREYQQWFHKAGLKLTTFNPRWDTVSGGGDIQENKRLHLPDYQPECLLNRRNSKGVKGGIARLVLSTGAWRAAAFPAVFKMVRNPLLSGSQKLRILVGQK